MYHHEFNLHERKKEKMKENYYLDLALKVIKEKYEEAFELATINPENKRFAGESSGLAFAFGAIQGVVDLAKKDEEKEDIEELQKAFENPEGLEFGDAYIEEDDLDEKGN